MITALLLTAGLSARFGSPKALVRIQGQTLLERQLNMLLSAAVDAIIVVLGAHAERIRPRIPQHDRIKTVYNAHFQLGQTSSVKAALGQSALSSDLLLLPVDFPFVLETTINLLTAHFKQHAALITIPTFNGHNGHPPIFSSKLKSEILQLDNGLGLNEIIRRHKHELDLVPVADRGILATFNTPAEFAKLKADLT